MSRSPCVQLSSSSVRPTYLSYLIAIHLLGAVENSINRNVRPGPVYCAALRHLTDLIVPAAVRRCVVAWIRCIPLRRCNAFDFCVLHLRRLQHLYR